MKIDKHLAELVLRHEASGAATSDVDPRWVEKVKELSRLCDAGNIMTHIAFFGTTLLAKAVANTVDLYAIKPKHAKGNKRAYSARSLAHGVLVPVAVELGIDLGVSGREPLNNQPYFRMERLDDGTPVHESGKAAFSYMLELVSELSSVSSQEKARAALRAFLYVRKRTQPKYAESAAGIAAMSEKNLVESIEKLVQADAEGGRRAQAVVAGLLDVYAGPERVLSGRINDPSRHYPGDVVVLSGTAPERAEKAFEVRDKPLTVADARIFARKCATMGVTDAAVVAVNLGQTHMREDETADWAAALGVGVSFFFSWHDLVRQVLFWSQLPVSEGCSMAVGFIRDRLIAALVSPPTVELWDKLSRK